MIDHQAKNFLRLCLVLVKFKEKYKEKKIEITSKMKEKIILKKMIFSHLILL